MLVKRVSLLSVEPPLLLLLLMDCSELAASAMLTETRRPPFPSDEGYFCIQHLALQHPIFSATTPSVAIARSFPSRLGMLIRKSKILRFDHELLSSKGQLRARSVEPAKVSRTRSTSITGKLSNMLRTSL